MSYEKREIVIAGVVPITPDEFYEDMKVLATISDIEERHIRMDSCMCEVLKMFGYSAGVEIFENTNVWYA